jgi:phage tail sheath gpL-like
MGAAETLQAAGDYFPLHIISCENSPSLPIELAASVAASWLCYDAPNVNMDGQILPVVAPPAAYVYTDSEIEALLAAGVTPLQPAGGQTSIVRLVTSQISVSLSNATDVELLREPAAVRTTALLATNVSEKIGGGLVRATETSTVEAKARDLVIEVDRAFEASGYIENVDDFLPQIQTQYDPTAQGRLDATNPHQVVLPLHQVVVEATSYSADPASS